MGMKKIINFLGQKFLYEGSFKDNKPDGYGTLKNTEGIVYQGNFKDGKMNGEGIYSGPQTLKNIIYKFTFLLGSTPSEYRVVGQFKNNKLHGYKILIFTSNGDFFSGIFRNGNIDKGLLAGWIVEEEGRVIAIIQWSKETGSYEYLACKGKSFDMKHERFVKEYEKQFEEHEWFPKEICKNKDEFKKKIIDWKKDK